MNERIRSIERESGLEIYGLGLDRAKWEAAMTKFTELIVKECVGIALEQKKWVEDMKVHNPHDEVWNKARIQQSQHIVDKIKEHFGVEE